ncbi:MAG: response regulator [Cyclobacteriaceae bacterium]
MNYLLQRFSIIRFQRCFLSFLGIISITALVAQAPQLHGRFDHFTTQNGLTQNDVRAIFQDSDGYLWVGTHGGLNRFDGYAFTKFVRKESDHYDVSSNLISSICEDTLGDIWIGTDDMGLMLYKKDFSQFEHFGNLDNSTLTNKHITNLFCDSHNRIWAITNQGLNIVTRSAEGEVNIEKYHFQNNVVFYGYEDPKGNIWFATQRGLMRYFGKNALGIHQFINYQIEGLREARFISSNDSSLLVTNNNGLFVLPYHSLENNDPIAYSLETQPQVQRLISDSNGNLWYTNPNGLFVTYKEGNQIKTHHFKNATSDPNSLRGNITTAVLEDNNNQIWVGTNGNGLNLYNPRKKNFEHFNKGTNEGSISYNKIRAISKDSRGNLWFGTEGGGINIVTPIEGAYDFRTGFQSINVNPNGQNFVYAITEATFGSRQRIFIGTGFTSHFMVIDNRTGNFTPYDVKEHPGGPVFCITQDSKGNLWIGTYGQGLYYYTMTANGDVEDVSQIKTAQGLSSNVVRSITEDKFGTIWVGTDHGVNKIIKGIDEGEKSKIVIYENDPEAAMSLSYDYILPIFKSENGALWIGTLGGGLNRVISGITPDQDQFERITVADGLPSNVIKSIEEDSSGNLWLATNNGLCKFNPMTHQVVSYGMTDGIQDLEFGELASITLEDGQMIFGGVNGFNTFYPEEIVSDNSEINIVLNRLSILNTEVVTGEEINGRVILEKDINRTELLELNPDENSFSISFSGLNFNSPQNNKYQYKLENFDKKWTNANANQRVAKYTNLPPGKYILKVKASNADGYWNSQAKSITIVISRPLWSTPYAMFLYIMVLGLILWFFRKYTIITNTRKNQLHIEHLEKEKIEELSQLKLRFYTNVSHEFRTPLTLILGLVERLKGAHNQLSGEERETYFNKIYRNSQVLLNLINQLLDFRKIEQGKMTVSVAEGSIDDYIRLLCENFNELARKKKIEYSFICEEPIFGLYDKDIIERIIFNLLSNAFKFTESEGEITITLEKKDDTHFHLEITDSGLGMSEEEQSHIFERFAHNKNSTETGTGIGLSYTKSLVELYNGAISFVSKKSVGTKFSLELPYEASAFDQMEVSNQTNEIKDFKKDVNWLIESSNEEHARIFDPKMESTILIVDDNEDILFYLQDHFRQTFNVQIASNGKQALKKCLDEHIDMVVSDVMMPEMDGFELCEKIKEDERINHIPIILLTARNSTEQKVKGYEKGADAYIGKPFEMHELQTRMDALLANRKTLLNKIRKNINLEPKEIEITSLDEKFLSRIMSYIEENIGMTEFTVDMLAKECGMSQLHLNKKLKVLVGQTANAFVRSIRLKRAGQLLAKDRYSVNEVMYEVGFIDAKYFRSCFKKEFGKTPSDYQKEHSL